MRACDCVFRDGKRVAWCGPHLPVIEHYVPRAEQNPMCTRPAPGRKCAIDKLCAIHGCDTQACRCDT